MYSYMVEEGLDAKIHILHNGKVIASKELPAHPKHYSFVDYLSESKNLKRFEDIHNLVMLANTSRGP